MKMVVFCDTYLRASPLLLSMWPCTGNLGRTAAVISSGSTRRDPGKMHSFHGPGRF
jgi:hypothetical protein